MKLTNKSVRIIKEYISLINNIVMCKLLPVHTREQMICKVHIEKVNVDEDK